MDAGASDGGNGLCPGQCVQGPPVGWFFPPNLLWIGAESDAPDCWPLAPSLVFEGHTDLSAPIDCGQCSCAPPGGSCALPAKLTAYAAPCAQIGASTPATPFDPASGWAGACDANDSIPAGKLCSGVKCVQSIVVPPPVLSAAACMPSPIPPQPTPVWKTFARACQGQLDDPCDDDGHICLPSSPPGFQVCIFHDGDVPCPVQYSPYTEKHVLYQDFQDERACTSCTCGPPAGGFCTTTLTLYGDGACGAGAMPIALSTVSGGCVDLSAGTALGSKSATPPVFDPGSCQPSGGGLPMGKATPVQPSTYCCLP